MKFCLDKIGMPLLILLLEKKVHAPKQVLFDGIKPNLQNAKIRHALHSTWENSAFERSLLNYSAAIQNKQNFRVCA